MNSYTLYLTLIVLIKLGFYLMIFTDIYLKLKGDSKSKLYKTTIIWEKKLEFIYIILVGLLMIFLFNQFNPRLNMITKETQVILFVTGIIFTIRSKWYVFTDESKWFEILQLSS